MATKKEKAFIGVRMPKTLREMIEKHVLIDTYQNLSEFVRDAIRQKIQREAPELYKQIFQVEDT